MGRQCLTNFKKRFCGQHWTYEGHQCPSPRLKDVQVPVCPLCDKPVPSKPGAIPDEAVSRHLDRDCKADSKRTPRCSKTKCKVRELIKVDCHQCGLNFCLKHRHPQDHECSGKTQKMSEAGRAALARQEQPPQGIARYFKRQQQQPSRPNTNQIQGNLSEDEALARALQASLNEPSQAAAMSQEDRMLALALAQQGSGQGTSTSTGGGAEKSSCQIS